MNDFFNNIEGRKLDNNQVKSIISNNKYQLVIASAGSGKTTTIIGKVKYLLEIKDYKESDLLVLSFTNVSSYELKERIKKETKKEIDVMTFHKLGLNIVKSNNEKINILDTNISRIILDYLIDLTMDEIYLNNLIQYIYKVKKKKVIIKYKELLKKEQYQLITFIEIVIKFLSLVKQNNYKLDELKVKSRNKEYQLFLILFIPIYNKYQNYLTKSSLLDFNDMINCATELIDKNEVVLDYKYIIVDEYQDISRSRYKLLLACLKQTDSSLFCVGDDFQCVFSFAGSNIKYFTNFKQYFKTAELTIIDRTYRFNSSLALISSKFIMKNKCQIKKKIKSALVDPNIGVKIINGVNNKELNEKLIEQLLLLPNFSSVFFVGRYHNDLDIIRNNKCFFINGRNNQIAFDKRIDLEIVFMTAHQSKGLQADYTFILNNFNKKLGFPSKIENDKIIDILSSSNERYPYAEERRLFYVAITRAKKTSFLLQLESCKSIFIIEIGKILKQIKE